LTVVMNAELTPKPSFGSDPYRFARERAMRQSMWCKRPA
jgi:hypothetical protein